MTNDTNANGPVGPDAANRPPVLAVVGPTAVGKTALAEEIAAREGGEIVSADSMQVYRGMDIGTAKPAPDERRVAYHCLDVVDPGTPFSAALYQRAARAAIEEIFRRGRLPVVVGGTGLYVRAALDDLRFPAGEQESESRARIEALAKQVGAADLHRQLAAADPASAALIHPNNVRRTIRALEMVEEGVSYAEQSSGLSARTPFYDAVYVGLTMGRAQLYERVDDRVDAMVARGLLGEVDELLKAGFRDALTARQAIGYKELVPVVEGQAALDDAVAAIKQATRRYAKRQLTWFRADPRIHWYEAEAESVPAIAKAVLARLGDATARQ